MNTRMLIRKGILIQQNFLVESVRGIQSVQGLRASTCLKLKEKEVKSAPQNSMILKVAIMGRPNVGKSTLINRIFNLELCGVSHKTHTTMKPFRMSFTEGDTQIVLVDTPGLVTHEEYSRFGLSDSFVRWKEKTLREADVVGVVNEVVNLRNIFNFHSNLIQNLKSLPESLPMFLILNKVDLILNKDALFKTVKYFSDPEKYEKPSEIPEVPQILKRFSKVFFTSAIKDIGVNEIKEYLLEQAKPGKWLYESDFIYDKPIDQLILDLVRARLLDIYPNEIPYLCKYEIEYLKETDLGEIICVCLVTCQKKRHQYIITKRKRVLRHVCTQLESDFYRILKRVFRIRLVVQNKSNFN